MITFSLPHESFVLGQAIVPDGEADVECETYVPVSGEPMQNIWIHAEDVDSVVARLRDHDSLKSVRQLNGPDPPVLLQVQWGRFDDPLITAFRRVGATVLGLEGDADRWQFTVRCPTHEAVSEFHSHCLEHDVPCTITSVSNSSLAQNRQRITPDQKEALRVALVSGYFAVPREVTLEELADSLGISDTAASQRIRRGVRSLLREQLGLREVSA